MASAKKSEETNLATARWLSRETGIPAEFFEQEAAVGRLPGVRVTPEHFLFHIPTVRRVLEERAARGENLNATGGGDGE